MSEAYIPVTVVMGTWVEEEIRQQPVNWVRSFTSIDNIRSAIDNFLAPLLCKNDLRTILTGVGASAFIGDVITPWLTSYAGKNIGTVPATDLVTNPMDYLNPAHSLLLVSFARSDNSPESVTTVELANQFMSECYHLPIICSEAGSFYQNAAASDDAFVLLMPVETHDRGFVTTSSIITVIASYLAVFAPGKINSQAFRGVANRCQTVLASLDDFSDDVLGSEFQKRIVYPGSDGLQGTARESTLKTSELTADRLTAFYDFPTDFCHGPKPLVNNETLVMAFVPSHPYTRQYGLDLLTELRRDRQTLRVVAIVAQAHEVIGAGPRILLPPTRSFIDMELVLCFLIYAQVFALTQSVNIGNIPGTPSVNGTVSRVVQGVVIHPWNT